VRASATTDQFSYDVRGGYAFDFSVLGTDEISSAILSLYGTGITDNLGGTPDIDITSFTPNAFDTWETADYDLARVGSTVYSSLAVSSFNASNWNDFTFSADGRTYLEGGVVKAITSRLSWDTDGTFGGTWGSGNYLNPTVYYADQTGTTNDPKLVVEHSAVVSRRIINIE